MKVLTYVLIFLLAALMAVGIMAIHGIYKLSETEIQPSPKTYIQLETDKSTCEFWYRAGRFDQLEAKPNTTNDQVKQDFKNDWLKQNK